MKTIKSDNDSCCARQKDSNADTSALERQIDQMVYELYGLTPEEIAIIEGRE